MKKMLYKIGVALTFIGLFSCENYLDITPDGQVKRDDLLSTAAGIEDAMYGAYSQLRSSSLYGRELSYWTLDVMAQYFECYGNNKLKALQEYDYEYSSVESAFESVWTQMYKNISNVNSILTCDLVANATDFPCKIYRGEALAMRAMMHFDLLRIFTEQITNNKEADGIPYATGFSLDTPEFYKAKKVYELILDDLLKAEELLADEIRYAGDTEYMTMRNIHLNIHAVRGILARVYLTMGNYEKAKEYANKVIDEGGFALTKTTALAGSLAGVLSPNETIFGIYSSTEFYSYVYDDLWLSTSFYSLNPREDYAAVYEENGASDYRLNAFYQTQMTGMVRFVKILDKFKVDGNEAQRPAYAVPGINMLRLPEMYYIVSECLARENEMEEAVNMLNVVRQSRGLVALKDIPTMDLLIEEVNKERYKELVGEGQTFFNMKRQNKDITHVEGTVFPASKAMYVVPIPDVEFEYRDE